MEVNLAGERTVPILPCGDVDAVVAFYAMLGFSCIFRQLRPYPNVIVRREGIELHFGGIAGFKPEDSYGSCIVATPDADGLYQAMTAGVRAGLGRIPVAGIPRFTRPRKRDGMVRSFSVVDPGGNWIRVFQVSGNGEAAGDGAEPLTGLAKALDAAMRLGDGKGDPAAAIEVLERALSRNAAAAAADRVPALIYRAELAVMVGDKDTARTVIEGVRGMVLSEQERADLEPELQRVGAVEAEIG
jgi:hypothetical protein